MNYIMDPYGVFQTHFFQKELEPNARVVKIDYLEANHNKYTSYMFGSSRIGTTNPSVINKYLPNETFYNFNLPSCNLNDNLTHLKFFITNKFQIKTLYLQIDMGNFLDSYELDHFQNSYLWKHHPDVSQSNKYKFYFDYLTILPVKTISNKIKINFFNKHYDYHFDIASGVWYTDKEEEIKKDPSKYIKNEKSFHQKYDKQIKDWRVKQNLKVLAEIKEICTANNINLIVFTTPEHHIRMDSFFLNDYYNALYEMSKITDFWNFSGYNSITTNDVNYYEAGHYRPLIGELIAAKIFNDKSKVVPLDFGQYVTRNNIGETLTALKIQANRYHDGPLK